MIGVLLPTKGRKIVLPRTLNSLAKTHGAGNIELVVLCDDDMESALVAKDWKRKNGQVFGLMNIFNSDDRLFPVPAFVKASQLCMSEIFCSMNDENVYEEWWLERVLQCFADNFPDKIGVLSLFKLKKAGLMMTSKSFVNFNGGEWFHPGYKLYYADDELTCRSILLGRYAFLSPKDNGVFHDSEITKKISAISWDDKIDMKRVDRGLFYKRSEFNFGLDSKRLYPWEGFREINEPIK